MTEQQAVYEVKPKKLTTKQQVFIAEYLKCFNASEAARRSGYTGDPNTIGPRLLANVGIKAAVEAAIAEKHMGADEALARMADMARADIGDLIDDNGLLDIREARRKGMTKLIRKIKQKTVTRIGKTDDADDVEITEIEFEMYSAQDALDKLLRAHGKYKDNLEVNSKIEITTYDYNAAVSAISGDDEAEK